MIDGDAILRSMKDIDKSEASNDELAERRTTLAESRTGWAQERTLLAKHRTFAAWIRTGLAALTVGFIGTELLAELQPQWLIRGAGALLIATAAIIFLLGYQGYAGTFRKLRERGASSAPVWVVALITAILVLVSIAGMFLVLLN